MAAQKILIVSGRFVPACVLYKGIITSQVHRHRRTADRTFRYQRCGDFHILLLRYHFAHGFLVIIGFIVTGFRALPQAVIALRVKQPFFIKASKLKLMVYIGC